MGAKWKEKSIKIFITLSCDKNYLMLTVLDFSIKASILFIQYNENMINLIKNVFLNKKLLLRRLIFFLIVFTIVIIFALTFHLMFKKYSDGDIVSKKNKFLYLLVRWNDGLGFSILKGKFAAICAIQLVFIFLQILILNLCKNTSEIIFLSMIVSGGLFNFFQRVLSIKKQVLDYFCFGFFEFPVFNVSDVFITIGIIGFMIMKVIKLIKTFDA